MLIVVFLCGLRPTPTGAATTVSRKGRGDLAIASTGAALCPVLVMSRCQIVGAIVLPDSWMDRVLAEIHLADEVSRIGQERLQPSNG